MNPYFKPGTVIPYSCCGDRLAWSYTIRHSDDPLDTEYHTYQIFASPSDAKKAMRELCKRSGNPEMQ